jgi:hypothetical protein
LELPSSKEIAGDRQVPSSLGHGVAVEPGDQST